MMVFLVALSGGKHDVYYTVHTGFEMGDFALRFLDMPKLFPNHPNSDSEHSGLIRSLPL